MNRTDDGATMGAMTIDDDSRDENQPKGHISARRIALAVVVPRGVMQTELLSKKILFFG